MQLVVNYLGVMDGLNYFAGFHVNDLDFGFVHSLRGFDVPLDSSKSFYFTHSLFKGKILSVFTNLFFGHTRKVRVRTDYQVLGRALVWP